MAWFAAYTAVLVAVSVAGIVTRQWSVAVSTIGLTAVFGLFVRRLWRRR